MARLTKNNWQEIRDAYEVKKMTFSDLAKEFNINRSNISRKAKKEGWNQAETQQLINATVCNKRESIEIRNKTHELNATTQQAVHNEVQHRLEMEGIYANFEKTLMTKAQQTASNIDVYNDEYATNKIVQLSTAHKNMRGTPDTQVNVQQNNQQTNVLEDIAESISGTLYSKVNERDHG